jgi:uncharacterized protein YndB with AHSA1/START domain
LRETLKPFRFQTSVTVRCSAPPEAVFEVIADLSAHLEWSGERASDDDFKLLNLSAPAGPAQVGTAFSSTGANFNGTFHDRSIVTAVDPPRTLVIDTDATLDRTHGRTWSVHFRHQYEIRPDGVGSRITYTDTIERLNYVPYWLQPWARPISRRVIQAGDAKNLENLAVLAQERASA